MVFCVCVMYLPFSSSSSAIFPNSNQTSLSIVSLLSTEDRCTEASWKISPAVRSFVPYSARNSWFSLTYFHFHVLIIFARLKEQYSLIENSFLIQHSKCAAIQNRLFSLYRWILLIFVCCAFVLRLCHVLIFSSLSSAIFPHSNQISLNIVLLLSTEDICTEVSWELYPAVPSFVPYSARNSWFSLSHFHFHVLIIFARLKEQYSLIENSFLIQHSKWAVI